MAVAHRTSFFTLAFLTLALAATLTVRADDPTPAVVEGTVINVQNSRTVSRASVTLFGVKGSGSQSVRADSSGHFIFQNVGPGTYKLVAERQGFFSNESKQEDQPVFEVASGAHVKNMPVRLMPAAVVSGEIVDEFNDPLQNVEIRLLKTQMRLGQIVLTAAGKAITDDRGQYRVAGLRPGKYYLVAEYKPVNTLPGANATPPNATPPTEPTPGQSYTLAGHNRAPVLINPPNLPEPAFTYPPLFYPATGDFQQAQALHLNPGDELAANFIFFSSPVVSIQGRVTNGMTGAPAKAASVAAHWTPYMEGEGMPARVSTTDGRFEVLGLAPGTYTLRTSFTEDGQTYAGERTVEVGNQGALNVDISGLPDFVASGRVNITGTPQTAMSLVSIDFTGEGLLPRVQASARFPDFKFAAQLRPDQRYRVNVRNLPEDYYLKSMALFGHEMPVDSLMVSGRRGDLELTLSPSGGQIDGMLFDQKEQPTRGSILMVPDVPQPGPPDLFRRSSADLGGKFTFRGVAPGSYRLVALDNVNLSTEINEPDFLKSIGNRGENLIVDENGKYRINLKLIPEKP